MAARALIAGVFPVLELLLLLPLIAGRRDDACGADSGAGPKSQLRRKLIRRARARRLKAAIQPRSSGSNSIRTRKARFMSIAKILKTQRDGKFMAAQFFVCQNFIQSHAKKLTLKSETATELKSVGRI